MKTLLISIFLVFFAASANAASFKAPLAILGTEYLFRGPQPVGKVDVLKKFGIEEVVIVKNETGNEVTREKSELLAKGYSDESIHHIPLEWKDIDLQVACKQTIEALQILVRAEQEGRRAYLHCTVGEDRTGMVAGLAGMLISGSSAEEVFENEMCARNYSNGSRNKPREVTSAIEKGLTPLFFALAEKIESGMLDANRLNPKICKTLKYDLENTKRCP